MVIKRGGSISIETSEWKADRVGGNIYFISGKTQPGMVVRSQGRETFAGPDGSFRLQISTPSAETKVEVGGLDANHIALSVSAIAATSVSI